MAEQRMTAEQFRAAIGLAEAAKLMRPGRKGKPLNVATLRQYANPEVGYRPAGYNGPPVVLMACRVGQDLVTLPEWVERFERERAEVGVQVRARLRFENSRSRKASVRRANEYLDAAGIV